MERIRGAEWGHAVIPVSEDSVPEHRFEIEFGSQLMRQEGVHAGVDRAPVRRNVPNVMLVVILRRFPTTS